MTPLVKPVFNDKNAILAHVEKVLDSGMIAEGEQVYEFERQFKKLFGIENGVSTSSGTAALDIIYLHAGIGPGDEVISTAMTAEPTNTAILRTGATVVFADVGKDDGLLSAEGIIAKITPRTKAICVVHYAGYVCDLSPILELIKDLDIVLIEDCAHALGAKYKGVSVGQHGDYGIFSFQAIKHMTTVDGGFLSFKESAWEIDLKKIRWFGLEKGVARQDNRITTLGSKYNFNNLNASIGLEQLKSVKSNISAHISNATIFNERFTGKTYVRPASINTNSTPSFWIYSLLAKDSEKLIAYLNDSGVGASKLHTPNHLHPIFGAQSQIMKNLDLFYSELVHLPVGPWVSHDHANFIAEKIMSFYD